MELVIVPVGPCRCPGAPHGEDTVSLAAKPTIALGIAAMYAIRVSENEADLRGQLAEVYLRNGIVAWTFVDAERNAVPVTSESIERLLPFGDGGLIVAEAAGDLYSAEVLRPLVERRNAASQDGPTEPSTSAPPPAGPSARKVSRRSSPTASDGTPSEVPVP